MASGVGSGSVLVGTGVGVASGAGLVGSSGRQALASIASARDNSTRHFANGFLSGFLVMCLELPAEGRRLRAREFTG